MADLSGPFVQWSRSPLPDRVFVLKRLLKGCRVAGVPGIHGSVVHGSGLMPSEMRG